LTKLSFILIRMVKLLYSRMAVDTSFSLRTLLLFSNKAAEFGCIQVRNAALIFGLFVIVRTFLQIVQGVVCL
jgi:hypothetical protein